MVAWADIRRLETSIRWPALVAAEPVGSPVTLGQSSGWDSEIGSDSRTDRAIARSPAADSFGVLAEAFAGTLTAENLTENRASQTADSATENSLQNQFHAEAVIAC